MTEMSKTGKRLLWFIKVALRKNFDVELEAAEKRGELKGLQRARAALSFAGLWSGAGIVNDLIHHAQRGETEGHE